MVTPPIFCAGYGANRSATASAHLPPKYPSCRGVTQDFAKSFSGQHGQPKYLSKRTVNIGKPTKELNGMSLTMLRMRHSFCRRPKRSANGPRSPSMSVIALSGHQFACLNVCFGGKRASSDLRINVCFWPKADIDSGRTICLTHWPTLSACRMCRSLRPNRTCLAAAAPAKIAPVKPPLPA